MPLSIERANAIDAEKDRARKEGLGDYRNGKWVDFPLWNVWGTIFNYKPNPKAVEDVGLDFLKKYCEPSGLVKVTFRNKTKPTKGIARKALRNKVLSNGYLVKLSDCQIEDIECADVTQMEKWLRAQAELYKHGG